MNIGDWSQFSLDDIFLRTTQKIEGQELCKYNVQRGLDLAAKNITIGNHMVDRTIKLPLVVCILHLITHVLKLVEELVWLPPSLNID
jgi:hypothetical protein